MGNTEQNGLAFFAGLRRFILAYKPAENTVLTAGEEDIA